MYNKNNQHYRSYLAGIISESDYYEILEGKNTIKSKDKVRNAVASIKNYWPKPGHALINIQQTLHDHGYALAGTASFNVSDKTPDYTQRFPLEKMINPEKPEEGAESVENVLSFSWHWMPSGDKCEITAYIS
jgi:hypothetical protein